MDDALEVEAGWRIPMREIDVRADPSGGPGGQHANRAATRVTASFDVEASSSLDATRRARILEQLGPVVRATSDATRSQHRNRGLALDALAARLREATRRVEPRRPTRPSASSKQRRLQDKRRQADRKAARRPPRPGDD